MRNAARGRTLARRGEKTKIGEDGKQVLIGTFGDTAALQGAIQQKGLETIMKSSASGNRMIHKDQWGHDVRNCG